MLTCDKIQYWCLIKIKKINTQLDPARQSNQGLPPTVKPSGLQQIQVDETNAIITIMNTMS